MNLLRILGMKRTNLYTREGGITIQALPVRNSGQFLAFVIEFQ